MTDHNIEELERQYRQAESRLVDAQRAFTDAQERLRAAHVAKAEADMAAKGITPGTKVVAVGKNWRGETIREPGIYIGFANNGYGVGADIQVRKITKSGKPHATQNLRPGFYGRFEWRIAE